MRRSVLLTCVVSAWFAATTPALATLSLLWLESDGRSSATLLSPVGTLVVGELRDTTDIEPFGYGVRWTLDAAWALEEGVGDLNGNADLNYRHTGLSATNVLSYWQDWGFGLAQAFRAPGATAPATPIDLVCATNEYTTADAISADGSTVAGVGDCGPYRWTEATGGVSIAPSGTPTSISDDGGVVVGVVDDAIDTPFFRSESGGFQIVPVTMRSRSERVRVSGDGSTLIGTAATANGTEAFTWNPVSGATFLGDLPGGSFLSRAVDVSRDGSLVAGNASGSTTEAFAWTAAGGMTGLGVESSVVDMTPNALVVGTLSDHPDGDDVFLWNPRTGWMRTLESLLRDGGVAVPADGLHAAIGISDDGRTIAGNRRIGLPPQVTAEPWLATIDPPGQRCDVEMSQASYVDGEEVVITSLRFTNDDTSVAERRLRLQLTLPFGITVDVLDLGASGGFFVPASFDRQLGPVTMFTLQPGQPRGDFSWRCALEEPGTGVILAEDVAEFAFE